MLDKININRFLMFKPRIDAGKNRRLKDSALFFFFKNLLIISIGAFIFTAAENHFFMKNNFYPLKSADDAIKILKEGAVFYTFMIIATPVYETFILIIVLKFLNFFVKNETVVCMIAAGLHGLAHASNSIYWMIPTAWIFYFFANAIFFWQQSRFLKYLMPMGLHSAYNLLTVCVFIFSAD